jgi:hypothetical protein
MQAFSRGLSLGNQPCCGHIGSSVFRAVLAAVTLSGCTIIEVKSDDGSVRVERSFGFSAVQIAPDAGVVTARMTSLGYVASPLGVAIGASRQTIMTSDTKCRVTLWMERSQLDTEIYERLKSIPAVCLID